MPLSPAISDKGLAVFAFALYHQLETGTRVSKVIADDGAGHRADPEAVAELESLGLVHREGDRLSFTQQGEAVIDGLAGHLAEAFTKAGGT